MTIKICSIQDIPALIRISIQSYREHYTYLWNDDGSTYIESNFSETSFNSQLNDANVALFLIYDDNKQPAGFLKLNIDKAIDRYGSVDALELERIYLIRQASGKGFGKKILDFVTAFSKERNKKYVWLKVMDSSAAINFYKHEGFEIIGQQKLTFAEMKAEFRGMHLMMKEI